MGAAICEPAWAKLNLTLDVLGRRPDGYHDMSMVMQTVDLRDEVYITLKNASGIKVDTDRDGLPRDMKNLAGKAAARFLSRIDSPNVGVEIFIKKRIPDKAGLAGGSADAAAVIRGLDKLLGTNLGEGELLAICAEVGSDVPFCLSGGTRLAGGRGEVLTALAPMPECGIVIVKPKFSVSTPELFAAIDDLELGPRPDAAAMSRALSAGDLVAVCRSLGNVFEQALPPGERGIVDGVKAALLASGALGAAMTGTGSAVFGIFGSFEKAAGARINVPGEIFRVRPKN